MAESISQRTDAIDDPMSNRAMYALLQSILTDMNAIKLAHNTHQHTAAPTPPTVLVGNFNTTV